MNREELLASLRPEIDTDSKRFSLPKEEFQNKTLRPILKFQNDALVLFFKNHLKGATLPNFKLEIAAFVQHRLQKDIATRNTLIGMVIGLMNDAEMSDFIADKNEMTKRIMDMIGQRIIEQLSRDY